MRRRFQKLARSLLETGKPKRLFEFAATRIGEQVESPPHVLDIERLAGIPASAQNVYWLWRFQCEAGICGIDVFILDSLGINSPQIHAALKAVGATELAHLLEVAIVLARDGPAEFKRLADQAWFDQFPPTGEFPELHLMNRPVFALAQGLTDLVTAYIRANEAELFED